MADKDLSIEEASEFIVKYVNARVDHMGDQIGIDDVGVLSFSKIINNWKGVFAIDTHRAIYYEVTYDDAKKETYIDVYSKLDEICIQDKGL